VDWGRDHAWVGLDEDKQNTNWGRYSTSMGITVEDSWLTGAHYVVASVTYHDEAVGSFTLEYDDGGGGGTCTVNKQGSGDTHTAHCFLSDFEANATGTDDDFQLVDGSGSTNFMFVRLTKCGGSFASCTS
ncbi:MAG: hypothetical protein GY938_20615, partial [Ketobacter sp.]|nr:hypothetical protein [Ketobacter sp.]